MNWADPQAPVQVTVPDMGALLADLEAHLVQGQGFSIATLNLDHAVKLARDPAFAKAYAAHSHITADGNPVVWLSHLAGQAEVKLVPGSELITPVAALAGRLGVSVGLFGATDASLKAAADALMADHPGLQVAFCQAPPMGFDPDGEGAQAAIDAIKDSGARVIFLALGAPKQERFAARAAAQLDNVGFLSIGAGLDFISGQQVRAPAWVRAIAAEWLWRLVGNPARLAGRYGACIAALPRLTRAALLARRTS